MNLNKYPQRFYEMDLHKRQLILAILITFCWTMAAAEVLAGLSSRDGSRYYQAFALLLCGATFFAISRKSPKIGKSSSGESAHTK
jgi:hypothetical protein